MKVVLNALKFIVITLVEAFIIFFSIQPIAQIFSNIGQKIHPDIASIAQDLTKSGWLMLFTILMYVVVGIVLFMVFKFIEVKLISKHTKKSYQYMLVPCVLVLIAEILYIVFDIGGLGFVLIWTPMVAIIVISNLVYEFAIVKKF